MRRRERGTRLAAAERQLGLVQDREGGQDLVAFVAKSLSSFRQEPRGFTPALEVEGAQPEEQCGAQRLLSQAQVGELPARLLGPVARLLPRVQREQQLRLVQRAEGGAALVAELPLDRAHGLQAA